MDNIQKKQEDVNKNSPIEIIMYDVFATIGTFGVEGLSMLLSILFFIHDYNWKQLDFYIGFSWGALIDLAKNMAILWLIINKPKLEALRVFPIRRVRGDNQIKMGYNVRNSYESFKCDWFISAWLQKSYKNLYRGLLGWFSDGRWFRLLIALICIIFSAIASHAQFKKDNIKQSMKTADYQNLTESKDYAKLQMAEIDRQILEKSKQKESNLSNLDRLNNQGSRYHTERERIDNEKSNIRSDNARLDFEIEGLNKRKDSFFGDIKSAEKSMADVTKNANNYNFLITGLIGLFAFLGVAVSADVVVYFFAIDIEIIGIMFWGIWAEKSGTTFHNWLVFSIKRRNMEAQTEISKSTNYLVNNISSTINAISGSITSSTENAILKMDTMSRNMELLYNNFSKLQEKISNPALIGASSPPSPKIGYEEFVGYVGKQYFEGIPQAIKDKIVFELQFIGEIFDEKDPAVKRILEILNDFRQKKIGFRLDAQPGFSGENKMLPDPDFRESENQGDGTLILGRKSGLDASRKSGSSENQGFSRKSGFPENQGTDQGVNQGSDNPENQGKNPADLMAYGQAIKAQKAKAREDMVTKLFQSKRYTYAQIGVMIPKNIGGPLKADSVSKIIKRLNLK